jgi:hypothetical protein
VLDLTTQLTQEVAVKFRLGAAAAAVAVTIVPGALFALQTVNSVVAYEYSASDAVVSGLTSTWQVEKLRQRPWTLHKGVDNPDIIPSGLCRDIANRWNVNVMGAKSLTIFQTLLESSAANNCKLQYGKNSSANADGSFDLLSVVPTE